MSDLFKIKEAQEWAAAWREASSPDSYAKRLGNAAKEVRALVDGAKARGLGFVHNGGPTVRQANASVRWLEREAKRALRVVVTCQKAANAPRVAR